MPAFSNGQVLNISNHSPCDDKMRNFRDEKTFKLWMKLHYKKCEICRNSTKKSGCFYKSEINCTKGETTRAYLDDFNKNYVHI